MVKHYLITGGARFIGSRGSTYHHVLLTYTGNLSSLASVTDNPRYSLARADIADAAAICDLCTRLCRFSRHSGIGVRFPTKAEQFVL